MYLHFGRQTPVYEASTMIVSTGNQTGNQTVNQTLVSAPPLPSGAPPPRGVSQHAFAPLGPAIERPTGPTGSKLEWLARRCDLGLHVILAASPGHTIFCTTMSFLLIFRANASYAKCAAYHQ